MHLYTEKISSPRNLIIHVKTKGRKRVERKLSRRCREEFRLFGVISRRRPRHMLDHRSIHKYLSDERNEIDEGGRRFDLPHVTDAALHVILNRMYLFLKFSKNKERGRTCGI